MHGIVYRAFNTANGKSYVGQTVQSLEQRRKMHMRKQSCRLFKNAISKYGADSFVWSVLTECSNQNDLNSAEAYWIIELGSLPPDGYNLMLGGGASGKRSEETKKHLRDVFAQPDVKAKRSKAQKENQARFSVKEKQKLAKLGKKRSDADRKKMSKNKLLMKYRWKIDPVSGKRIFWSEA
jgi:group I intron endonuclease